MKQRDVESKNVKIVYQGFDLFKDKEKAFNKIEIASLITILYHLVWVAFLAPALATNKPHARAAVANVTTRQAQVCHTLYFIIAHPAKGLIMYKVIQWMNRYYLAIFQHSLCRFVRLRGRLIPPCRGNLLRGNMRG